MIIKLNNVRLSFPDLFVAKAVKAGDEPAYSAHFIMPKDHPDVAKVEAAILSVAKDKWGAKADEILRSARAGQKLPLHDGDAKPYDGYAGNLYVSARNKRKPDVIDRDKTPLTAADGRPYSGCYVNASVELWAQDNSFGKRINSSLLVVQYVKHGEHLAGGAAPNPGDFDELPEDDLSDLA